MTSTPKNASVLLIGASRGLGYAIAEEYVNCGARVVATVRGHARTALHDLQGTFGGLLEIEHVDITVPDQVQALRERLGSRTFDLLFVNAGVGVAETVGEVSTGAGFAAGTENPTALRMLISAPPSLRILRPASVPGQPSAS